MKYIQNSCFFMVLILFFSACETKQNTLALNLELGKTYPLSLVTNSDIKQTIAGSAMSIRVKSKLNTSFLIKAINKNDYDMEVFYTQLSTSTFMKNDTLIFSSEGTDTTNVISKFLAELINKPFNVKLSKMGKILEIRNLEALFEREVGNLVDPLSVDAVQVKKVIVKSFGTAAFKQNIEMLTAIYPEKNVGLGDNWSSTSTVMSNVDLFLNTTYTFDKSNEQYNYIVGSTKITADKKGKSVAMAGVNMEYNLKGTMKSVFEINKQSGWIHTARLDQKITGKAIVKAPQGAGENFEIPMELNTEIRVEN